MAKGAKERWFDSLCDKRARRGYSDAENAEYRADLDAKYADWTDEDIKTQLVNMRKEGHR